MIRLFFLSALCLLFSCKKDNTLNTVTANSDYSCLLSSETDEAGIIRNTYVYQDSRISRAYYFDNYGDTSEYKIYTYNNNTVTINKYNGNNILNSTIKYLLNKNGNAYLKVETTDSTFYQYNNEGYLTRYIEKHSNGSPDTNTLIYENGKRTTLITKSSTQTDTTSYSYSNFKIPLKVKSSFYISEGECYGDPIDEELFLGRNTDFAISSITIIYGFSSPYNTVLNYTYTFNGNKLSTINSTMGYSSGNIYHTFKRNFFYQCPN